MAVIDEMVIKWSLDSTNFNSGISKINQSMKVVKSEFEATSSKVDAFGNETDKLKAKAEYLTKTLKLQEEKVKSLKDQYEKSKKETGENSRETQNLAIKVNKAVKYYNNLEKQLKDVTKEISKSDTTFKKFAKTLNDNKEKINDYSKKALKGFTAVSGAIVAAGTVLGNFANDFNKSLNSLAVSTNATKAETEEFGEVIKNVYADKFGESFEDVADTIGVVVKTLGLTGDELQEVTEYAFGFRDAFGYDISESIRAAKALMDNFGLSAEDSFDLMVQGEQKGLDYSGELIDNINEYSVQFKKLGFTAEDMFNIFESGAQTGAWNLDKIGDAVKEFSIRAIDGSNTTIEGFQKLGYNADEMANKFAAGGDTAKEAFYQIIDSINSMQDPVEQSIVGVDLFGTMWEDLGPEVVGHLGDIKNGFDSTVDSAKKMNEVQYNDLGSGLKGLWREIQVEALEPLNNELMPKFNEFYQKIKEHMPGIKSVLKGVFNVVSDIVIFLLDNGDWIAPLVGGIAAAIGILNISLWAMNAALLANPAVWIAMGIVAAIGAVIAIGVLLVKNWDTIKAKCKEVFEAIKQDWNKFVDSIKLKWEAFKIFWKNVIDALKQDWDDFVNRIKLKFETITYPFRVVVNKIREIWNDLKNNFKLPHFSLKGEFSLKKMTVPHVAVDWYYTGGIFKEPTILGGGIGVGDAYKGMGRNAEAVVPLDSMYANINNIVDRKLKENQQPIYVNVNVTNDIDGLKVAGAVTNKVIKTITRNMKSKSISKGVL